MNNKKFIVAFGGAFSPVTNAHLTLAEHVTNEFDVQKVVFIPVGDVYGKKELLPAEHRINMLKAVIDKNSNFALSTLETGTNMVMKTIDTMTKIKRQYPENKIAFLMGTDNLRDLVNWYKYEALVKEFYFMVVTRDGDNYEEILNSNKVFIENKDNFINVKNTVRNDASSSYVRKLISEGKSCRYFVPEEVYVYLLKNKFLGNIPNDKKDL